MLKFMVLCLVLCGCSSNKPEEITPTPSKSYDLHDLLDLHNAARKKHNIPDLKYDHYLVKKAGEHSKWMYDNNELNHSENGIMPWDRITGRNIVGENIAECNDLKETFDLWMNDAPHKKNILNKDYKYVGFGRVGNYWTADFSGE